MPNNPQWHGRLVSRQGSVAISGKNLSGGAAARKLTLPPPLPAAADTSGANRARASQALAPTGLRSEDLFDDVANAPIEPSPEPQRGLHSGAFTKNGRAGFDALRPASQPPSAARSPFEQLYGTLPSAERAELRVDDLSLDIANPFLASSLQPPPPRSRLRVLGWVGGALALVGLGYASAAFYGPTRTASRPAAAVQAPAVRAAAAVQAPAVPAAAVVQAPAVPAAVVVQAPAVPAAPAALVATAPSTSFPEPSATPLVAVAEHAAVAAPEPVVAKARASTPNKARASAKDKPRAHKPRAASTPAAATEPSAQRQGAEPSAAVAAQLPVQPTRAEVRASMESMRGALQSCAGGAHGEILSKLTVSADGRVMHSLIQGAFVGTPQGSCMARALRGAKFPPFSGPSLNVGYPYVF